MAATNRAIDGRPRKSSSEHDQRDAEQHAVRNGVRGIHQMLPVIKRPPERRQAARFVQLFFGLFDIGQDARRVLAARIKQIPSTD